MTVATLSLAGCGKDDADAAVDYTDTEYDYSDEQYADQDERYPDNNTGTYNYDTENELPKPVTGTIAVNPTEPSLYADYSAIEHAKETGSMDYLEWLAGFVANVAEPQAMELLLRVPVFEEAAKEDLLSRYISLGFTYSDYNMFGAITRMAYLDKNGSQINTEDTHTKAYNIGFQISVNTAYYTPETRNDPAKQKELEDTLLHELTHAIMADYIRNGGTGLFEDGSWAENMQTANGFPDWFGEGTAITMQCGYSNMARDEALKFFYIQPDTPREERLDLLDSTEEMDEAIRFLNDALDDEEMAELEEELGYSNVYMTDLTIDENQYVMSYFGTMYIYYLAARSMGFEAFGSDGVLDMDIMRSGMGDVFEKLHDGYSLNQLIAEISVDPDTGRSVYPDVAALEQNFLHGANEPGMVFLQKMLYDFESRVTDDYIPSGSVIPGVNNYQKPFMDDDEHEVAEYYGIVYSDNGQTFSDYYAVSTVRPSLVAHTGGFRQSYTDAPAYTPDEAAARDILYIGNSVRLIDTYKASEYRSPADWIKADELATGNLVSSDLKGSIPDLTGYSFVRGYTGDDNRNIPASVDMYEDDQNQLYALTVIGDNSPVFGKVNPSLVTGPDGEEGVRFDYFNGSYFVIYNPEDDVSFLEDERSNIYTMLPETEKEAREYAESLR